MPKLGESAWTNHTFKPILNNLYVGQKIVMCFSEGQKFQFLSGPLPPICHVSEFFLQIKQCITMLYIVISFIFSRSNAPYNFTMCGIPMT
jgi:hypothetical protein